MPWLYSAWADSVFILSPAFLVTLAVLAFPSYFQGSQLSPGMWLLLVVGVDVAHVYSTLYRTYLDPEESQRHRALLLIAPIACWVGGILLYSAGRMTFWRVLAYLAVFHFVRQQYGFLRLYSRREMQSTAGRWIDGCAIYLATLYPLVYWHTHPRPFQWFVDGDFFALHAPGVDRVVLMLYITALVAYVISNWRLARNWPKHLVLAGTAMSWYTGIVLSSGDIAFTVTNVLAHGVPYMALIWFYERKKSVRLSTGLLARWFRPSMIPAYLGLLLLIAFVEEGLWDVLVWRDHTQFYQWLAFFPQIEEQSLLSLVVPLLAVPQATHYIVDGFIWRLREMRAG